MPDAPVQFVPGWSAEAAAHARAQSAARGFTFAAANFGDDRPLPPGLSLSKFRFWPFNQGPVGTCACADTEVLTNKGWVAWPEYNWADLLGTVNLQSRRLEFQAPLARHIYDYDGEMVYSTNKSVDFGVTPDHRMLVRKWDERRRTLSNDYSFQRAGDLGWYSGLMHAPSGFIGTRLNQIEIEGDREYSGDDFVALLSLICSDGYAGASENTRNWVSFCCFEPDRRDMVAPLAVRLGFQESESRQGVWTRYKAGALAQWVRTNCYTGNGLGAINKRIPDLLRIVTEDQLQHFAKFFGDKDHKAKRDHFYSSSRRLIDDLQELYLRIGRRATISKREPRSGNEFEGRHIQSAHPAYELHVRETDRLSLERKKDIETEHYKGLVYCATVPNSTLITRRNGSILISGNCWENSATQTFQIMTAAQGKYKPVPLSRCMVGWQGKKLDGGGNPADGGSILHGMLAMSDPPQGVGVCHEEKWPYKPDRHYFAAGPPEGAVADANLNRVHQVSEVEPKPEAIKRPIMNGHPVDIGISWPGNWDQCDQSGRVPGPGWSKGGHAIVIIGWLDEWDGHTWYQIENSHGAIYHPLPPEIAARVLGYKPAFEDKTHDFWVREEWLLPKLSGGYECCIAADLTGFEERSISFDDAMNWGPPVE